MSEAARTKRGNWFTRLADDLLGLRLIGVLLCLGFIRLVAVIDAAERTLPSLDWIWLGMRVLWFVGACLIAAAFVYQAYRGGVALLRRSESLRKIDKRVW